MKCGNASPYGKFECQLDRGHEGWCFDGMHQYIEQLDTLGRDLIFDINDKFKTDIQLTKETTENMRAIVSEHEDMIMEDSEYGYCPDCDQKMPDEPMRDESRD